MKTSVIPLGAVVLPKNGGLPIERICNQLHISQLRYGEDSEKEESYIEVDAFVSTDDSIAVPRAYARKHYPQYYSTSDFSSGHSVQFTSRISHTGEYAYQKKFVDDIVAASDEYSDFLVQAKTGKGKTVCALSAIARLGRTTLIVVDQENLLVQWRDAIVKFLGVSKEDIGIIQGKKKEWHGYGIAVATVQTLVSRSYEDEFYSYFGTVVFDEVHSIGAPTFSQVLMMFSARTRFGVSATVDRRDSLQKLLKFNLGEIRAQLTDTHKESYVYYVESDTVYSWYANISPKAGRILSEVAEDTARNRLLVLCIKWLYDSGRDVIALSDRIEQLEYLRDMCYYAGVDETDMGLYTGYKNVYQYEKNPKPKTEPDYVEYGAPYTPVRFVKVQKRVPVKELQSIAESSRIIFATYGKAAKGLDIPRLSGGIDCTPRARAEQAHGRILRAVPGKPVPIWVTVRDVCSYRLEFQFASRVVEYAKSNAGVKRWILNKGVRLVDVKELAESARRKTETLKNQEIRISDDGNYTLVTQTTPIG